MAAFIPSSFPLASASVCSTASSTFLCPQRAAFQSPFLVGNTPLVQPVNNNSRTDAGAIRMDIVVVRNEGEPIESTLRRFKREVAKSGVLYELRRRQHFESTAEKRLRKKSEASRRAKMARIKRTQNQMF